MDKEKRGFPGQGRLNTSMPTLASTVIYNFLLLVSTGASQQLEHIC